MDLSFTLNKTAINDIKLLADSISFNSEENRRSAEYFASVLRQDSRKGVNKLADVLDKRCKSYLDEVNRVRTMYSFDSSFGQYTHIAGIDEVGRGPLAGPIVAAAVVLNLSTEESNLILGLNDSKKISEEKRETLSDQIKEKALCWSISLLSAEDIDSKGIAYCNNQIFINSYESLSIKPELVLTDGYPIKNYTLNNKSVVKGDQKSASIAAASILAKVFRDNLMKDLSKDYPGYGFESNAGYGSKKHFEAIGSIGMCPIHRKTFLQKFFSNEQVK